MTKLDEGALRLVTGYASLVNALRDETAAAAGDATAPCAEPATRRVHAELQSWQADGKEEEGMPERTALSLAVAQAADALVTHTGNILSFLPAFLPDEAHAAGLTRAMEAAQDALQAWFAAVSSGAYTAADFPHAREILCTAGAETETEAEAEAPGVPQAYMDDVLARMEVLAPGGGFGGSEDLRRALRAAEAHGPVASAAFLWAMDVSMARGYFAVSNLVPALLQLYAFCQAAGRPLDAEFFEFVARENAARRAQLLQTQEPVL